MAKHYNYYICSNRRNVILKKLPQISEAEYEVMKIIWKYAPISTNEVIKKLTNVSKWSPKTIQTMLLRLLKKEALTYEKSSRVFIYSPLVQQDQYLDMESSSFLNRFYDGTLNSMVLNFIEKDKLSDEDISELQSILNSRDQKGVQ